jgi:photosystem II stability/assembly factor-like uncharacterized protein
MKNILHIILISIISLIVISCAKKSDSSSSSSSTCTSSDVSFLAVGASGTILTSADGTCWTAQTSGTTNNLRAFAIKPSTIGVVVGYSGTILTTTDGTTWTSRTSGTSNSISEVIYDRNIFFGVGENATYIYSQNGTSWSSGSPTGIDASAYLSGVAYGLETWVTVGASGVIYTIKDEGTAYTLRTSGTTVDLRRVYSLVE